MADMTRKAGEWITDENDNNSQSFLYNAFNGDKVYFKISFGDFDGGTIGLNCLPNDPLKMTDQEKNSLKPDHTFRIDSEHFKRELKGIKNIIESMTEGIEAYDAEAYAEGLDDRIHDFGDIKKSLNNEIQAKRIREENEILAQDKNAIPPLSEADISAGKSIVLERKTYDSNTKKYSEEQKTFNIIASQEKTIIVSKEDNEGIALYNTPNNNNIEKGLKEIKEYFHQHTYEANIYNICKFFDENHGPLKRLKFDLDEAMSKNIRRPETQYNEATLWHENKDKTYADTGMFEGLIFTAKQVNLSDTKISVFTSHQNYEKSEPYFTYGLHGNIETAKKFVENTTSCFENKHTPLLEDIEKHLSLQINEHNQKQSQQVNQTVTQSANKQSEIETAKKAGYVQGVCECVAAVGNDYTLGQKLLTEMKVSKKMAKEYASPETYKTLENGIFARKQEQKLEYQQKRGHRL
jgi:hypothetical protein